MQYFYISEQKLVMWPIRFSFLRTQKGVTKLAIVRAKNNKKRFGNKVIEGNKLSWALIISFMPQQ